MDFHILIDGKDKVMLRQARRKVWLHFLEPDKKPSEKLLVSLNEMPTKSKPNIAPDDGYWGQVFIATQLGVIDALREKGFEVSQI